MEYILRTFDLVKKYKSQYALNKVNINIKKGDIYGFVGENGSGKTTVIRVITGLIFPTSGSYELFGVKSNDKRIYEVKQKLGAVVETPSIYNNLSAYDNLKMQCSLHGIKDDNKIIETLSIVGLKDLYKNKKHAGDFSLGMRQRLGIAMALINDPEFIILDEPMNGLDPQGIVEVRELILKLNKEYNITFLISSHILTELSLVATTDGIISKGKIIKEISNTQLENECRKSLLINVDNVSLAYEKLLKHCNQDDLQVFEQSIRIYGDININEVLNVIINSNIKINNIKSEQTNIEDYYLSLVRGDLNG